MNSFIIKSLSGSKTFLLMTHNMDEVERLSSRVAIMDNVRILVCDTPAALRQKFTSEAQLWMQ